MSCLSYQLVDRLLYSFYVSVFFCFFYFLVCLFYLFKYKQMKIICLNGILWNLARRADGVCKALYGSQWNLTALTLMWCWLGVFGWLARFHVVWLESSNDEMVFHEVWAIFNRSMARQKLRSPGFDIVSGIWFYFHSKFVWRNYVDRGGTFFLRDGMTAEQWTRPIWADVQVELSHYQALISQIYKLLIGEQ